jgi:hypothetical protein
VSADVSRVTANISTSLDGAVCGPNDGGENPLGDEGERLHGWVYDLASWRRMQGIEGGETNRDGGMFAGSVENDGAVVMGRRMFGDGTRLFDAFDGGPVELERTRVIESPAVTHLRYRVGNAPRRAAGRDA